MARLWSKTVTYQTVSVGDYLPILVKWETTDTIARLASLLDAGTPEEVLPRPGDGEKGTEAGSEDSGTESGGDDSGAAGEARAEALVSYVTELLEKGFPLARVTAEGSSVALKVHAAVKAEDTISLSGQVTGKRLEGDRGLVECEIRVENQDSALVAEAMAVVSLPADLPAQ